MADLGGFWRAVETIHDVVYFAPDAQRRYEALGLKGWWMGYVVSRAGALGTPPPEVVVAAFHNFAPAIIHRALPDGWAMAEREEVLAERLSLARDVLTPVLAGHDVVGLADRLALVVHGLDLAGKPLAAAEASLPVPSSLDDPVGALWRRATVLREFRGDCHVAVLVSEGLGGASANVLQVATGRAEPRQRTVRGWTEEEWAAAQARLQGLGWVGPTGEATLSGRSARDRIEAATDRSTSGFLELAREEQVVAVTEELLAAARAVADAGAVPFPNPTGGGRP